MVAVNNGLDATPGLANDDPYGSGWLFEIVPSSPDELDGLLDAAAYEATLAS